MLSDLRHTVVTAGCYEPMVGRAWARVSREARDLVARLLRVDRGERPPLRLYWSTVEHEWFHGDLATVPSARQVMGLLEGEEEGDCSRGSSREEERGVKRDGEEPAGKRRRGPTEGAFGLASEERGR